MYILITLSSCLCITCTLHGGTVFDKSNLGITIADLRNFPIPADTEEVVLQGNAISWIPVGYFKNVSILREIYLYRNDISDIQDLAFAAAPSVEKIELTDNKISMIKKLMFSGLPHLVDLKLAKNEIHTLEVDCFKENPALEILTLNGNQVERMSRCIFDQHHHPTGLHFLALYHNPLVCDSSWCWVKEAELENWITLHWPNGVVCAGPAALKDFTWAMMTEQNLNCSYVSGECKVMRIISIKSHNFNILNKRGLYLFCFRIWSVNTI